jgi:hypothetical protein
VHRPPGRVERFVIAFERTQYVAPHALRVIIGRAEYAPGFRERKGVVRSLRAEQRTCEQDVRVRVVGPAGDDRAEQRNRVVVAPEIEERVRSLECVSIRRSHTSLRDRMY